MTLDIRALLYLIAAAAFIIGLKRLSGPRTARSGNRIAAAGMLVAIVVTLIILWLFRSLRLITEVRGDGLYVRFFPFHFSFKRIPLEEVETFEAVTYRPLLQYGGWGIRFTRGGKAYNVSGNRGVRLNFTNGRHLLIGSQKADELTQAIESVFQLFPGRGGSFQGDCAGNS